jgi:hypothetical protein
VTTQATERRTRLEDLGPDELRMLVRELADRNAQLQRALESRIAIEQAKGVLAERLRVDIATAFAILRGAARSSQRRIHDLAGDVVASRDNPREIVRELVRRDAQNPAA